MTKADIKVRASENLEDEGLNDFYSSDDLNDSYEDGYEEVVALTQSRDKMTVINFSANLVYYDFYDLISDYLNVIAIFNRNTNRWLEQRDDRYFRLIRDDWELADGNPTDYWAVDFRKIAFFPHLKSASGAMEVFYAAKADFQMDADSPELLDPNAVLLEYYMTADLLEQAEEYTKAQAWWEMYINEVRKLSSRVGSRLFPDRVSMYREQYLGRQL